VKVADVQAVVRAIFANEKPKDGRHYTLDVERDQFAFDDQILLRLSRMDGAAADADYRHVQYRLGSHQLRLYTRSRQDRNGLVRLFTAVVREMLWSLDHHEQPTLPDLVVEPKLARTCWERLLE
jgi:hypothetical protein